MAGGSTGDIKTTTTLIKVSWQVSIFLIKILLLKISQRNVKNFKCGYYRAREISKRI